MKHITCWLLLNYWNFHFSAGSPHFHSYIGSATTMFRKLKHTYYFKDHTNMRSVWHMKNAYSNNWLIDCLTSSEYYFNCIHEDMMVIIMLWFCIESSSFNDERNSFLDSCKLQSLTWNTMISPPFWPKCPYT